MPFVFFHAGKPHSNLLLATDARGPESNWQGEVDHGAFGITATDLRPSELSILRLVSERPAYTIARLGGELSGVKHPETPVAL